MLIAGGFACKSTLYLMITHDPLFLTVVLLGAGVLGLTIARFVHLSPIVGFIAIGAVIGPHALGLIDNDSSTIHFLGELGVSFLLFDIGLHLSLEELRVNWKRFFALGALQCITTTLIFVPFMKIFGIEWFPAFVLGIIFSLSSTAIVLKLLSDEHEDHSPVGKRATEILVFQDIVAILVLVLLSGDLSHGISLSALGMPLLRMTVAAIIFIVMGRYALKPLFRLLISVKSDEVITAFALLLVLLASLSTQAFELSLSLGAFLGGLSLSESTYSYLVRGEVAPFRSLLLSLFFLSVGINLDLGFIGANIFLLVGLLCLFTVVKIGAGILAYRVAGIDRGIGTFLSFLLSQGSEFAFVLLGMAGSTTLINSETFAIGTSLIGFSLAVSPFLSSLGCFFSRSVCQVDSEEEVANDDPREVIIVRIDDFGRQLANLLHLEKIPYRAHDQDLERLTYAKSRGLNVYYSDLNRPRTLGRVSMGKATAVVSLLEDDTVLYPLIEGLKKVGNSIPLIAATESPERFERLTSLGVEPVFIKRDGSLIALFEAVVRSVGYDDIRVDESINRALTILSPQTSFPNAVMDDIPVAQVMN